MKEDDEPIPAELQEEMRAWVEQVIMERALKLEQTTPEVLKTPEGKEWMKLRDTLREELPQYHGALSPTNLRKAMKILDFSIPRRKKSKPAKAEK